MELGFRGLVVSDYNAVQQCGPSYEVALASCINTGIDMVMTAGGLWGDLPLEHQLRAARRCVEQGAIPLERIDDAVRRILRVKAALGLPMPMPPPAAAPAAAPVPPPAAAAQAALQMAAADKAADKAAAQRDQLHACVGCASHRRTAREAVRKSAVLLRLRNGVLPLQARRPTTPPAPPCTPAPPAPPCAPVLLRPCTAAPPLHLCSGRVAPSCSCVAAARTTSACSAAAGRCSGRASRATRTRAARQSGRSAARPSPGASPPTPPTTPTLALVLALALALILDLARACSLAQTLGFSGSAVRAVPLALPPHVVTAGEGPFSRGAAAGTACGAAPSSTAAPSTAVTSCLSKPRDTAERGLRAGSDRAASGRAATDRAPTVRAPRGVEKGDQSAVSHEEGDASRSPPPPPPRPAAPPPRTLRRTLGLDDAAAAPRAPLRRSAERRTFGLCDFGLASGLLDGRGLIDRLSELGGSRTLAAAGAAAGAPAGAAAGAAASGLCRTWHGEVL